MKIEACGGGGPYLRWVSHIFFPTQHEDSSKDRLDIWLGGLSIFIQVLSLHGALAAVAGITAPGTSLLLPNVATNSAATVRTCHITLAQKYTYLTLGCMRWTTLINKPISIKVINFITQTQR